MTYATNRWDRILVARLKQIEKLSKEQRVLPRSAPHRLARVPERKREPAGGAKRLNRLFRLSL